MIKISNIKMKCLRIIVLLTFIFYFWFLPALAVFSGRPGVFGFSCFAMGEKPQKQPHDGNSTFNKDAFIESAKSDKVLRIGLVDCITYALKNNSDIKIKRIEPLLKEDDIKIAKADFEPTLSIDYTLHDNAEESTSTLYSRISKYRDIDLNAGVSGRLITGTEYDIELLTERYGSNSTIQRMNPYYSTEPKVTITQPLFGDYGIFINRANIVIACNNKESSEESFKDKVMEIITDTKVAYYAYLYYLESYSIANSALERAKDLLEINKARYAKGLISSVELLETETAVAQKQKALISAESDLKKSEDNLKLITNLVADPEIWNAKLELIDTPKFEVKEVDLVKSLENAFSYRPDYLSQKIDLKNRNIKIKVAQNAVFPTIDLAGSFGLNGLGEDYKKAIDDTKSEYKDWSVGAKFSMPWGGEERAELDQRRLEKAQALIKLKNLEQNIILEVRDKVRGVDIQYRQAEAAKLAKEKETKNYDAQKERYAAGQVSTHDMLDYQDKLAQAELDYIKALIDYNTAIINLDKAEGLTLVKNNVKLEE